MHRKNICPIFIIIHFLFSEINAPELAIDPKATKEARPHMATTTIDKLLDYVIHTPPDGLRSASSVKTLNALINKNLALQSV